MSQGYGPCCGAAQIHLRPKPEPKPKLYKPSPNRKPIVHLIVSCFLSQSVVICPGSFVTAQSFSAPHDHGAQLAPRLQEAEEEGAGAGEAAHHLWVQLLLTTILAVILLQYQPCCPSVAMQIRG